MSASDRPMRLNRTHVRAAAYAGLCISVGLFVSLGVDNGFTWHLVVYLLIASVLLVGSLTWSNWRDDNRHERYLRSWRATRPKVPPKTH